MNMIYDATLYKNRPNDTGMTRIRVVYGNLWPGTDRHHLPPADHVRSLAAQSTTMTCLDVEHFATDTRKATDAEVEASLDMLGQIADWFREGNPHVRLGYYTLMPRRDYWNAKRGRNLIAWAKANARFRYGRNVRGRFEAEGLADKVDVLFPSLYTFYEDRAGWLAYAKANIREARRYQKQVYPFIWPQYHDSNKTLRGQYIPADYWRMIVETCLELADGLVVWGGWQQQWSDDAPWYRVIREYLR